MGRVGHGEESENHGKDFHCDGLVSGRGGPGHTGVGRYRDHQHHAGGGDRAHARDWVAQGAGCDSSRHFVSFFAGGSVPHAVERSIGGWLSDAADSSALGSKSAGRFRYAAHRARVGGWCGAVFGVGRDYGGALPGAKGRHARARRGFAPGVSPQEGIMTRDLLKEAFNAMQHNRRRTALTMLGMAWGIATVVILLAFGSGFERAIDVIFSSWGTDVIGAFPGRTSLQAGGAKA